MQASGSDICSVLRKLGLKCDQTWGGLCNCSHRGWGDVGALWLSAYNERQEQLHIQALETPSINFEHDWMPGNGTLVRLRTSDHHMEHREHVLPSHMPLQNHRSCVRRHAVALMWGTGLAITMLEACISAPLMVNL